MKDLVMRIERRSQTLKRQSALGQRQIDNPHSFEIAGNAVYNRMRISVLPNVKGENFRFSYPLLGPASGMAIAEI
jgi:hypothetical protein